MLSVRDELKCFSSYQLQPLHIATLHIDQWLHKHTALFFFAQIPTQRSAALLGIYLTHICALFKLTHTLAACDWAVVTMMKIKWTILSLSSSDLHSNSILPSLSPAVTLHAIPHKFSQIATAVHALKWSWGGRRAQKFRQHSSTRLNGLYADGSLQSADIGIFGFVNVCIHFILGNVLFCRYFDTWCYM